MGVKAASGPGSYREVGVIRREPVCLTPTPCPSPALYGCVSLAPPPTLPMGGTGGDGRLEGGRSQGVTPPPPALSPGAASLCRPGSHLPWLQFPLVDPQPSSLSLQPHWDERVEGIHYWRWRWARGGGIPGRAGGLQALDILKPVLREPEPLLGQVSSPDRGRQQGRVSIFAFSA